MVEAVDDSILDCFTLKPRPNRADISISGQIKASNKEFIFVEIVQEHVAYLKRNCEIESYDIHFHINRVPFQLQRNALDLIANHNLFQHLINNPKYDEYAKEETELFREESYTFRYSKEKTAFHDVICKRILIFCII